ncbi:MAG: sulfite exporter TauE/SafE family protein [Parapedobacter sp.]|nr:MAG: sulfite exporter TauE/SafE family protein [Parapedobacter sp.]
MDPYIVTSLLIILIGFTVSSFGNLIGFGGGIFMVPILVTIFHYPLAIAVGSVMFSLIFSSLMATYRLRKEGHVDFKMGTLLEIPTMFGVILGSLLLSYLSTAGLEILFSVLVFILGLSFWLKKTTIEKASAKPDLFSRMNQWKPGLVIQHTKMNLTYRASLWLILFFGLSAGTLAGLFGIGGGFMKTPIMLKVFKMPVKVATATALFMILITSITGSISHYLQGHILFSHVWPVIIGFVGGAIAGNRLTPSVSDEVLERLIGLGLILAALVMFANFYTHRGY